MTVTNQHAARGLHADASGLRMRIVTWTGPASYLAGGELLGNVNGIGVIEAVVPCGNARNATVDAVELRYDHTTGKLQAFDAGAEVADAVDLSAFTARLLVIGK